MVCNAGAADDRYTVLEQGTDISGPVSIHSQVLPRLHPPKQAMEHRTTVTTTAPHEEALLFYSVCDKTLPGKVVGHISDS